MFKKTKERSIQELLGKDLSGIIFTSIYFNGFTGVFI